MSHQQPTFITNHGAVVLYLAAHPDHTMREVAQHINVTERTVARIISKLKDVGLLSVEKNGQRNRYRVDKDRITESLGWDGLHLFAILDDVQQLP